VPALKVTIEDLKAGRLEAGWDKLEHYGVIKEVTDGVELRERAVEDGSSMPSRLLGMSLREQPTSLIGQRTYPMFQAARDKLIFYAACRIR
jgi:hypothetical protein